MSDKKTHHEADQLEGLEHALSNSEKFIEKNQKMITNITLGIIVLILAFMAYNRYIAAPKNIEAQSQLFAGEMLFQKDSFNIALEGDGNFMGFEYVIDKYGSTPSGNLAKYYSGICYFNMGDYDMAIKYLNKFKADGTMMPPIKEGAIGDCYIEMGDYDKAIVAFKKAASFDNDFTVPIYLKKCGIAYEANGEPEKAIECYKTIKAKFPNCVDANDMEKYIAHAQSALNN